MRKQLAENGTLGKSTQLFKFSQNNCGDIYKYIRIFISSRILLVQESSAFPTSGQGLADPLLPTVRVPFFGFGILLFIITFVCVHINRVGGL